MQGVFVAVAPNRDVHVLGSVLGRAGAQAVGAEREVVVAALVVVILAAGVELAKDELPVKALLGRVPVERAAAAVVLYLNGAIAKDGKGDELAVTLARLVNGVGQDLEAACAQPSSPSEPKMTAGRRRTRSSSLSWRILSLP